ncbi:protein lev-9, partial [Caerostris extrusa]
KCGEGLTPSESKARCSRGEWIISGKLCVEKPCSVPKVDHGKIGRYVRSYGRATFQELPEGAKNENKEKLYLTCEAKYEPFGTAMMKEEITCILGELSRIPRCEPAKCEGPPPLTHNADVTAVNRTHKGGVVYLCKRYFEPKKYGNVTCSFGTWKGDTPVCEDTSCDSKDIDPSEGITLSEDEKTRYLNGEHLIVECGEGLTPSESKARCSRGEWVISGKLCVESSCNVVKLDRGAFTQQVQKSEGRLFFATKRWIEYEKVTLGGTKSPGSSLYVACNEGYTFQGTGANDVEVKCRSGKFYPNPVCLITGVPYDYEEDSKQDDSSFVNEGSDERNPPENKEIDRAISVVHEENSNRQPDVDNAVSPPACTCTYTGLDDNVIAYYGTDILKYGQQVKKNETVKFRCRRFGFHRLTGTKEITCEDCRPWHSAEYPECELPETGEAILGFPPNSRYLPGNTISYLAVPNLQIVQIRDIVLSGHPSRVLYISNISEQHNGQYECNRYPDRKKVFNIQVK